MNCDRRMFQNYVQGINKLTHLVIARYKMESIYIQNLMKGQGSLELAMEILKKERKKERLTIYDFIRVWFTRTRLFL